MPVYEFKCTACEHIFDEFRHAADDTQKAACPECGERARRKYSLAGFFDESAGFRPDNYWAFGNKRIESKRQLIDEMRRAEAGSTWEYTDPITGEVTRHDIPMELEANAL